MKVDAYKKFPRLNPHELEKPISEVYEEINTECNNFLKTQKGLQYLMLKYPTLSMEQAIREHYAHTWICENYDGTDFLYEKIAFITKNPRLLLGYNIHIMYNNVDIFRLFIHIKTNLLII